MSFRRHSEAAFTWKKWVADNRSELMTCGIPDWIWSNELRWLRFLEEGGIDGESKWNVSLLSSNQAKCFRDFVLRAYEANEYKSLLRDLERMSEQGQRT